MDQNIGSFNPGGGVPQHESPNKRLQIEMWTRNISKKGEDPSLIASFNNSYAQRVKQKEVAQINKDI